MGTLQIDHTGGGPAEYLTTTTNDRIFSICMVAEQGHQMFKLPVKVKVKVKEKVKVKVKR